MKKQSTTPTEKYLNAKCKDCIHFWILKDTDKARCTEQRMLNKIRKIENFQPCIYFEE